MIMKHGKYETTLMKFVPASPKDWTEQHIILLTTAAEVDRLTDAIVSDSERMAKRFTEYAASVKARELVVLSASTPPCGSSAINDIAINSGRLHAHVESLLSCLTLVLGKDGRKTFLVALRDAG
jgi:hypothetical protein